MSNRRIVYYDLLNILACFCVVCLHSNAMVHTYVPGLNWIGGLAIEVVCYWAVPIFFMLSGANLMRYTDRYDTKTFFKKKILEDPNSVYIVECIFLCLEISFFGRIWINAVFESLYDKWY